MVVWVGQTGRRDSSHLSTPKQVSPQIYFFPEGLDTKATSKVLTQAGMKRATLGIVTPPNGCQKK